MDPNNCHKLLLVWVCGGKGEEHMSEFHGISIAFSENINAYYLYKRHPHMQDKNVL